MRKITNKSHLKNQKSMKRNEKDFCCEKDPERARIEVKAPAVSLMNWKEKKISPRHQQ